MIGYFRRKIYEETDDTIVHHEDIFPVLYDEIEWASDGMYVRGVNLSELDVFYFRAVGGKYGIVNDIVKLAVEHGKPIADKYLLNGAVPRTKKLMHSILDNVVYQPASLIAERLEEIPNIIEASDIEYPVVAKVSKGGRRGLGTFMLHNPDQIGDIYVELERRLEEGEGHEYSLGKREWIVQEYIPNNGDYRAMVIGGKCVAVTKRGPKKEGLVMSSSQRGSRRFRGGRWPKDVGRMAEKAANTMGVDIAGVDLVRHEWNRLPYVIEVNEAPRYKTFSRVTRMDIGTYIVEYLRRIASGRTQS